MLWENDGSPTDIVNLMCDEVHSDGAVMDSMRKAMPKWLEEQAEDEARLINEIAARVQSSEVVALPQTGLMHDISLPDIHYHGYPLRFRMKAAEQGITLPEQGYECWACPDFLAYYRKKYPELVARPAPRAPVITICGKYEKVTGTAANRNAFTHGGLIAA